ncbi:hypothetical protein [Desulfogranum japonicum]|uniref:hypothetical protein n=1 Tax=Desulfogranum japonicum TaxID=231447 RepID=UPI0003F8F3EB|nr:hypothetical protein [Desulfogranum japonicum]
MYDLIIVICSTLLGFCLSLITFILIQKIRNQNTPSVENRLKRIQKKIDTALEAPRVNTANKSFERSLEKASMTTELQVPRIRKQCHAHTQAPEKYTILAKLISQGMEPEEIASLLDISMAEVTQLITLKNMASEGRKI